VTYRCRMTTNVSLITAEDVRPVGSDGLTDDERVALAARYRATAARTALSAGEKDALDRWYASRAGR
jgi:hypothetical protein